MIAESQIASQLTGKPGTYLLNFESGKCREIEVGKLGVVQVSPGFYIYVGSAFGPGGLKARLTRHAKKDKRNHWHIDYLARHLRLVEIWFTHYPQIIEHQLVGFISSHLEMDVPLVGFGSSDCGCDSHLFYASRRQSVERVRDAIGCLGGERIPWERISGGIEH